MPSGPQKRKSAKKKKKAKPSKSSDSTPVHSPRDDQDTLGESTDGGELSSPASNSQESSPKSETTESNPSAKQSSTAERTEKASDQKNGKIEIDRGSRSPKPHDKKKAAVIEPAPDNSSPEKGILNPVNNNRKRQEKNDSINNHLKETGLAELVEKLVSVDETTTPKSKDCLTATTLNCPFCGRGSAGAKENEMPACPERHPLLDPNPQAPEKTSWKSCCGIFEMCSK
ncbi:hypothetical protein L1887_33790 [Cichorium endivia]|nr:hypothetical protein L1887_33790 [Cichorium endivia]